MNLRKLNQLFVRLSKKTTDAMASPLAFMLALLASLIWLASGPFFHFSDGWNFAANSSTTIINFLMGFLILFTQGRDAYLARLERQVILKAISDAPNMALMLEEDSDDRVQALADDLRQAKQEAEQEADDAGR